MHISVFLHKCLHAIRQIISFDVCVLNVNPKNAKQSDGRKERNDMKGRLCMCVCVEHFERDSQLIGGDNEGNEYCFL